MAVSIWLSVHGCVAVRGSGHALMAQGPPQQHPVMPQSSLSAQMPQRRPTQAPSKGGHCEATGNTTQMAAAGVVMPGINILLVAVEHLAQWLPPTTLVSTPAEALLRSLRLLSSQHCRAATAALSQACLLGNACSLASFLQHLWLK